MDNGWMTTGEAAGMLGVSRQHVVDLCNRGDLGCIRVGTHRRIRHLDVQHLTVPELTREEEKSLWLHRALLGPLMRDPRSVLELARENISRWLLVHRADGMSARYLLQWQHIIDSGVDSVVDVLTGTDETSSELRQNSPFAGVLTEDERRQVLRSFSEYWDREHAVA